MQEIRYINLTTMLGEGVRGVNVERLKINLLTLLALLIPSGVSKRELILI